MIDRVVRRAISGALAFGAVTAGTVIAFNLLPVERLRELPGWFILLPFGPWILLPVLYVAVFWSSARRPAPGFRIGRHRGQPAFVVLNSPVLSGPLFIVNGFAAGNIASHRATGELFAGTTYLIVLTVQLLGAALVVGLSLWSLYRVGVVRLTPDAIVRPFWRRIPWDNLAPDGPSRRSLQGAKLWLLLQYHAPGGPQIGYEWYSLDLRGAFVNREFLTSAIRYYREHPAARAAIGTPDGLHQLLTAVAGQPAASATPGASVDGTRTP